MAVKTNFETNGYKYYKTTKTIGHNLDGTAIKKTFYGKSKTEAEEKAENYLTNIKSGMPFNFDKITLGQMLDDWLYNIKRVSKDLRASSFERYESTYKKHIKDTELTGLRLCDITTLPIQRFYNQKYNNGTTENQIKEINKVLKNFFSWCVEQEYIKRNPCSAKSIELPGKSEELGVDDENEIYLFKDDEVEKIVLQSNKNNDNISIIVLLALGTGLRQGEILALPKKNLNLTNKTIKVEQTLKKVKIYESQEKYYYENKLQKPKTKTSIRTVNIPDNLISMLKNYIIKVEKKYNENNLSFSDDSLIFVTKTCSYIDAVDLRRSWRRFLERACVNYQKFHALRHTYASMLFKNGATILEVKELLGHSDSKITEKIYIHLYPESKESIVNKLNDVFKTR